MIIGNSGSSNGFGSVNPANSFLSKCYRLKSPTIKLFVNLIILTSQIGNLSCNGFHFFEIHYNFLSHTVLDF